MNKVKIFSHTDLDGVGCAILAYLAFGEENVDVEYCGYDDVDRKVCEFASANLDVNYDHIFITDISISEDTVKYIGDVPEYFDMKWRLFDHHATALGLNKYDWCTVELFGGSEQAHLKTCGTELFYEHLRGINGAGYLSGMSWVEDNIKRFVEIVRDYDTWRWAEELGEDGLVCKQLNDLLYMYGHEKFIKWCLKRLRRSVKEFPAFGEAELTLLESKQNEIDIYVEQKDKQLIRMVDKFGKSFGVVFAERFTSELGNRLSALHGDLEYIAIVDICSGKVSYRTVREGIHLGKEIAHSYGGGGHDKAAGSTFNGDLVKMQILGEVFGGGE